MDVIVVVLGLIATAILPPAPVQNDRGTRPATPVAVQAGGAAPIQRDASTGERVETPAEIRRPSVLKSRWTTHTDAELMHSHGQRAL